MIDQDRPRIVWEKIGTRTAVWCETEEEAAEFVRVAHEHGYRWLGSTPDGCLCRGAGSDTVYYIRDGHLMWGGKNDTRSYVDDVVPFSELLEPDAGGAKGGKPRICEVLGVEKFERICEAVHNGWWDEKKRQGVTDHPDMIPYDELAEDIKEYDRVTVRRVLDALGIRYESKPRFTEEEVAQAEAVKILFGMGASIHREEPGLLYVRNVPANYHIPIGLFPSIRPGQAVRLEEVIGDERGRV